MLKVYKSQWLNRKQTEESDVLSIVSKFWWQTRVKINYCFLGYMINATKRCSQNFHKNFQITNISSSTSLTRKMYNTEKPVLCKFVIKIRCFSFNQP